MHSRCTVIALDATADFCSVAWTDGEHWVERCEPAGQHHSALMLAMVDATLREAGCGLRNLSEVAFGAGPGSFTGLRIACGVAQGLALGAALPVRALSSLLALAQASGETRVVAALDARMNEVYWAAYRRGEDAGGWHAVHEPAVARPSALLVPAGDRWVGVGNGFAVYPMLGAGMPELARVDASVRVSARAIAELALANQGMLGAPDEALPHYVRDKVALTTAERAGVR
jgi:tRNA threonylcarbamoyladenosine biosynthesis protein TsaB